jgi:O-antigen/teichoic acid export membrane protein
MRGILHRVVHLSVSRRAQFAVMSTAALSLASLLMTVAIARKTSVDEFGQFAIAMVIYLLTSGLVRSAVTDTALARAASLDNRNLCARRASLLSVVLALLTLVGGVLIGNPYVVVMGLCLHGLISLDYIRVLNIAVLSPQIAWRLSLGWSLITVLGSALTLSTDLSVWWAFVGWSIGGVAMGYGIALGARYPLRPGWSRDREATRAAGYFALDFLAGAGSSALTTVLVGISVGPRVVGALRGASTLLGPAAVISSTCRSLAIPFLVRSRGPDPHSEQRAAVTATLVLGVIVTPLVFGVLLIPDRWGEALLGATWAMTAPILLPMAVEALAAMVASIPSAGHRAAFAGGRSLLLRLVVGIPRPVVVLLAAAQAGALGAAWAMAGIAVVNVVLWWVSYLHIGAGDRA